MNTLVNVALILLAVIVLGGMLRTMSFPRILPEGFEDASKKPSKKDKDSDSEKEDDAADDSEDEDDSEKEDVKPASKKAKGKTKTSDKKQKQTKKKSKASKDAPADSDASVAPVLDFDTNMKNFLSENGDNDKMMGRLHVDAKKLMKNQEQLMSMLSTTKPMLESSMNMVKSFKGMFGSS